MRYVDLSIVNYAHGGGDCDADTPCGTWDFAGLRRMMREGTWPDMLVICEAERWALTGGKGAWGAALALRQEQRDLGMTERPYIPLAGTLTQNRGPIAPCILVDPTTISVRQWFDGTDVDAYERTRNLLEWWPVGREEEPSYRIVPQHFPWNKPMGRVIDAEELTRYARDGAPPIVIPADFNTSAAGNDVTGWNEHSWWQTVRHSQAWRGHPELYDSLPLDMLLGVWDAELGKRVGPNGHEPGFYDVAELVDDLTPTESAKGPRVAQRNMRFLVNAGFRDRIAHYEVHDFTDPDVWDSDHKRVSITLEVD